MLRKLITRIVGIFFFIAATHTFALQTGATLSLPLIKKDPPNLHGAYASYWFQPDAMIYQRFQIYFELGAAHWSVNNGSYSSINTFSISPVLRAYFKKFQTFSPYLELSIGPTYLSKTHLGDRNLGMHFAFQDYVGVGSTFGKDQRWFASIDTFHYSNAALSKMNAGITIPVVLRIGYRFT